MLQMDGLCTELLRSSRVPSPNYDALVRESARFTRAYAAFPLCAPARASALTARPPQTHGQLNNHYVLHPRTPTAIDQLSTRGVPAWLFGKQHTNAPERESGAFGYAGILNRDSPSFRAALRHHADPLTQGRRHAQDDLVFAEIRELVEHGFGGRIRPHDRDPDWTLLQSALDHIDTLAGDWLVHISLLGPHHPYSMPERFYTLFQPESVDLSDIDREGWRRSAPARALMRLRRWDRLQPIHFQHIIARQLGYIAYMDWLLGRCLAALRERDLLDEVLFVFTTDHGVMAGKNGTFLKTDFDDRASRIEMVFRQPGVVPIGDHDGPASALDTLPTIAGLVGLAPMTGVEGQDLSPTLLLGDTVRDHAYSWMGIRRSGGTRSAMVTDGRFKYQCHRDGDDSGPQQLLYDLDEDPNETRDLCAADPERAGRMKALVRQELARYSAPTLPMATKDGAAAG